MENHQLHNSVQLFYTTTLTPVTHISPPHNMNHPSIPSLPCKFTRINLIHFFLATLYHPPHSLLLHLHRLPLKYVAHLINKHSCPNVFEQIYKFVGAQTYKRF
ncbi:LOW QUALITY PROTEIN: hypothetical protein HID58_067770 [Brassica napus]|uniref:Uncharacterized protein n=1 Tax=Brassica napus TaxID=3708 RepID=A0ABQ7ZJN8_BRANA|nr:LOW QUALITY PROTEIN: hypothetical protein HID58_067770 [Brassica napus]